MQFILENLNATENVTVTIGELVEECREINVRDKPLKIEASLEAPGDLGIKISDASNVDVSEESSQP